MISTHWARSPVSSSCGGSSRPADGGRPTPSRSRRRRPRTACASRSKISATTPPACNASDRACGCWPKARTAPSPPNAGVDAGCCSSSPAGSGSRRCARSSTRSGPGDDVVLLYRVATNDDIVFAEELGRFAAAPNMRIHVIPGTEIGDDNTDLLERARAATRRSRHRDPRLFRLRSAARSSTR